MINILKTYSYLVFLVIMLGWVIGVEAWEYFITTLGTTILVLWRDKRNKNGY